MLTLDLLALRLRSEGMADTPQSREWLLGRLLAEVIGHQLAVLRGRHGIPTPASGAAAAATSSAQLAQLQLDARTGDANLEAWSLIAFHYLALAPISSRDLAQEIGIAYRTVARRLLRGHLLLAQELRSQELAAASAFERHPGAPARARVVVTDAGPSSDPQAALANLLAAVRDDERVARLALPQIEALLRRPVPDLATYRLTRIAEWSRPAYRLDERFVRLSLLLDRGEDVALDRWWQQPQEYADLGGLLDDVDEPALVLLGPPGSGKSTLLRRLETDMAIAALRGTDDRVTFLVSLNGYRPSAARPGEGGPLDWLTARWKARYPLLPDLTELMRQGCLVLLADGLNEMPHADAADYRRRIGQWREFLQSHFVGGAGNRAIFSCRSLDYSAPLSSAELPVPQVRIEPMTDGQVRTFLAVHVPGQAESVWRALAGTAQLDLFRRPYLLKLLVDQVATAGRLPTGRAALFSGFVREMLRREIAQDNPLFRPNDLVAERDYERLLHAAKWPDPFELLRRGLLIGALAELAFAMQRQRKAELSQVRLAYEDALAIIAHRCAEDVLRAAMALGLMDRDWDTDEVMFHHQLLQEYFAARRLAAAPEPQLVQVAWRADEVRPPWRPRWPNWRPPIPFRRCPAPAGSKQPPWQPLWRAIRARSWPSWPQLTCRWLVAVPPSRRWRRAPAPRCAMSCAGSWHGSAATQQLTCERVSRPPCRWDHSGIRAFTPARDPTGPTSCHQRPGSRLVATRWAPTSPTSTMAGSSTPRVPVTWWHCPRSNSPSSR